MDSENVIKGLANDPQTSGGMGQPVDYSDWHQMIGSASPEEFGRAAYDAIRQIPPQDYTQHITPGWGGTDPLGQLPHTQRSGLAESILNALANRGIEADNVAQGAGLSTTDPSRMSPGDLAGLLQWTQQNQPQAFGDVASQYRNQPNVLQALLGPSALISMLTSLGAQFLSNRAQQNQEDTDRTNP